VGKIKGILFGKSDFGVDPKTGKKRVLVSNVVPFGSGGTTALGFIKNIPKIIQTAPNLIKSGITLGKQALAIGATGLLAKGFLSSKAGREKAKSIPSKIVTAGEKIGKIGSEEQEDISLGDVAKVGGAVGLLGAGVVVVDKFLEDRKGKKEKKDPFIEEDNQVLDTNQGIMENTLTEGIPVGNNPITEDPMPMGMITETVRKPRKKTKKKPVSQLPSIRLKNQNYINIKNVVGRCL